jgi:hypothetical protein
MKIGYRPKIALITHDVNNETEEDFCPLPSSYTRLVKQCIMENPFDRPTCKDIQKSLKKMCPLQMSPIDLIFKRMSLYQTSLEQAVQLRTYELEQEKHKSENLLYSKRIQFTRFFEAYPGYCFFSIVVVNIGLIFRALSN